jgi:hypothetical protein
MAMKIHSTRSSMQLRRMEAQIADALKENRFGECCLRLVVAMENYVFEFGED